MKLSFGMIFSIFLMIIFIAAAFYGIKAFIKLQQTAQIEKFASDLQSDIKKAYNGGPTLAEESYVLPKKINSICFRDNELKNLMFISSNPIASKNLEYLNIFEIISSEEPYCIDNIDGRVNLIIKKEYPQNLVTITR